MKKILFLTYVYPYGYYNASAACSTRIMQELANKEQCEVHCISYSQKNNGSQPYKIIPGIVNHYIELKEPRNRSRFRIYLRFLLHLPTFPIDSLLRVWLHYKNCINICRQIEYDLVVAQCYPLESVLTGVLLKRAGVIKKLVVVFWDNIYGKSVRFVPAKYVFYKSRKFESFIAKYADSLISLYPIKPFHDKYGDVPGAQGKRFYLGIPSILPPQKANLTKYLGAVIHGKINVLYSGTIIRPEYMRQVINIFNSLSVVENINLIFFSKGYSSEDFEKLKKEFRGTIQNLGYIPINELLSVYNYVDFFMSFPGDVNSICSKCYEYMSYGRPMILFYRDERDVNIKTFSKYPLFNAVDMGNFDRTELRTLSDFLKHKGKVVNFDEVERLFPLDSPKAYADFLLNTMR